MIKNFTSELLNVRLPLHFDLIEYSNYLIFLCFADNAYKKEFAEQTLTNEILINLKHFNKNYKKCMFCNLLRNFNIKFSVKLSVKSHIISRAIEFQLKKFFYYLFWDKR